LQKNPSRSNIERTPLHLHNKKTKQTKPKIQQKPLFHYLESTNIQLIKMKKIFTFVFITTLFFASACKEDVAADWKIINEQWWNNHKNDSGFITDSITGLMYKIHYKGWEYNPKPNLTNAVNVTYVGKLVDGYQFDAGTVDLLLSSTVKGFQQGVVKLHPGGKCTLYIPSKLGYDATSTNTRIPANSILLFEITLNQVYY